MKDRFKLVKIFFWIFFLGTLGVTSTFASVKQISVTPLSPEAGKASVYEIAFSLTESFPSTGRVVLDFPADFDLSQAILAGSPNVNGGFKVFVEGQKVIVRRSGLGAAIAAGQSIILRVANIRNPKSAGTYSLSFQVLAGKRVLGEVNSVSFSVLPRKRPLKPVR
ncbi:MAG: hypothetical protein GXO76_14150 [Calditrichaeota bacterium]|nr:hypothetical protein [Calditrichota bacterium]